MPAARREKEIDPEEVAPVAGQLVQEVWGAFLKEYGAQLKEGINRGIIEQDLEALIDRSVGVAKEEYGGEFAKAVLDRFADEIKFCSGIVFESVDKAVEDAKTKYFSETPPEEEMDRAA